jgi:hypothetical protein
VSCHVTISLNDFTWLSLQISLKYFKCIYFFTALSIKNGHLLHWCVGREEKYTWEMLSLLWFFVSPYAVGLCKPKCEFRSLRRTHSRDVLLKGLQKDCDLFIISCSSSLLLTQEVEQWSLKAVAYIPKLTKVRINPRSLCVRIHDSAILEWSNCLLRCPVPLGRCRHWQSCVTRVAYFAAEEQKCNQASVWRNAGGR